MDFDYRKELNSRSTYSANKSTQTQSARHSAQNISAKQDIVQNSKVLAQQASLSFEEAQEQAIDLNYSQKAAQKQQAEANLTYNSKRLRSSKAAQSLASLHHKDEEQETKPQVLSSDEKTSKNQNIQQASATTLDELDQDPSSQAKDYYTQALKDKEEQEAEEKKKFSESIAGLKEKNEEEIKRKLTSGLLNKELTPAEQQKVKELQQEQDKAIKHAKMQKQAAGAYASDPIYKYVRGPDGKQYVKTAHVKFDITPEKSPQATIMKMQIIKQAALINAKPTPADQKVHAAADKVEVAARQELNRMRQQELEEQEKKRQEKKRYAMSSSDDEQPKFKLDIATSAPDSSSENNGSSGSTDTGNSGSSGDLGSSANSSASLASSLSSVVTSVTASAVNIDASSIT